MARWLEKTPKTPKLPFTPQPYLREAVLSALKAAPALALDTETTGLNPRTDRLRCVQFFLPDTAYVIDVFTVSAAMLRPIFAQPRRWIGHNLKFDFKYLVANGLPCPTGDVVDTMLLSQLLSAAGSGAK